MDVLLVPDTVISNDIPASGWPSGLTIAQVWADQSILTRVRHVNGAAGTLTRVGFTTYTLQANERCAGIRILLQVGQTQPVLAYAKLKNSASMAFGVWAAVAFPTKSRLPHISPWFARDATDGLEWTQADINGLEVYVEWRNPGGTFDGRVYDLGLQLDIRQQPTTLNIFPGANAVIDSSKPTFIWRTQQNEGDAVQNRYTLKVWTKAVAEGGGFDPDTSGTVLTATKVTALTRANWPVNVAGLTFGEDYYWAVQASVKFLNGLWASEWSELTPFSLNEPPTADVLTPTGAVTTTNTPFVTWDYIDTELNVQSEAEVRVFAQPGGTWVGFNPDVATPLFSKILDGDGTSVLCTTRLPNAGTYRAYVRVSHKLSDGSTLTGPWAFNDFTTNYTAPAAPTLAGQVHNERVMLTMTPPAGPWTPDIDFFMMERSVDGGITWGTFRYGTLALSTNFPDNTTPLQIFDYEPGFFRSLQYRAFSVSTDLGLEVLSLASNTVTLTVSQNKVWIVDPSNSTLNTAFPVEEGWLNRNITRQRTFHRPLGRSKPVATRGVATDTNFSTTFLVVGQSQWDRLMALLMADRTLFVETPKGSWYVEVAGDIGTQDRLWDRRAGETDVWKVTVPWQEVDIV